VGGQRVDTEQSNRELLVLALACEFLGLLGQQDLVVGVERLRDVDLVEDGLDEVVEQFVVGRVGLALLGDAVEDHRILDHLVFEPVDHLLDPLGPERVLAVDEDRATFQAAVFGGQLDVDRQLMGDLGLAGTELAVDLRDRLGLDAPTQQLVDLLDAPGELADLLATFEHLRAALEPADVGGLAGGLDDVGGTGLPDVGGVREFARAGDRDALIGVESVFLELLGRRRAHARQVFEVFGCCHASALRPLLFKASLTPH